MSKIAVLVTGIGGGGHGEQILRSLKLINNMELEIIGTDITEYTTGRILTDFFYLVPPVMHENYEKTLFNIIKQHNVKFIFHGSEPELKYISENREKFERMGVGHPLNSHEIISLCMNKYATYTKLNSLGITLPKFVKIDSISDLAKVDFFPVILKPSSGSGGSTNVFLLFDQEELNLIGRYLLKLDKDIVAQEYIGDKGSEYTIGVSSSKNGEIIGSVIIKRLISNALTTTSKHHRDGIEHTISSGISQGFVCKDPNIARQAENIALKINSSGPLNIQCRVVEGELMLFEINPRLSGTTFLRAMSGYNEPELMLKNYLGIEKNELVYNDKLILRTIQEIELSI